MADLTFAEPLHMLEGSEYSPWVKTIFASIKIAARIRVLRKVPGIGRLVSKLLWKLGREKHVSVLLLRGMSRKQEQYLLLLPHC